MLTFDAIGLLPLLFNGIKHSVFRIMDNSNEWFSEMQCALSIYLNSVIVPLGWDTGLLTSTGGIELFRITKAELAAFINALCWFSIGQEWLPSKQYHTGFYHQSRLLVAGSNYPFAHHRFMNDKTKADSACGFGVWGLRRFQPNQTKGIKQPVWLRVWKKVTDRQRASSARNA